MPEQISGRFSDQSRGDSEQRLRDVLERLELLERMVAEMATMLAGTVSPRRKPPPRRRGDTVLRVVRVALVAVLGVAAVVAVMAPRHLRDLRYSPRCAAACAQPVAHHSRARNSR